MNVAHCAVWLGVNVAQCAVWLVVDVSVNVAQWDVVGRDSPNAG